MRASVEVEGLVHRQECEAADGLRWFRVSFAGVEGQCFITTGEALRLRELNSDWVRRAIENLGDVHGADWLRRMLTLRGGLQLHYVDASDTAYTPTPLPTVSSRRRPWTSASNR
jgi:hypothetical protein